MPVDTVPRTNEIKEKMWVPGPDGDMYVTRNLAFPHLSLQYHRFDNLRYFWGFVQLQDMLDNAIIEMRYLFCFGAYSMHFWAKTKKKKNKKNKQ